MATKSHQKYVKMDPIEHILTRPEMYIGSVKSKIVEDFVVTDSEFHIEKKDINVSPGILRIFIEPLANAIDNVARTKQTNSKFKCTKISVSIDEKTGKTTFWNDGDIIPIEIHNEEKCYNHTLIFGHLLTGSNYDDNVERLDISGRNGLGIKSVNCFSKFFSVEGVDPINKKKFYQEWSDNMKTVKDPVVENIKITKEIKGYTKITYIPDFSRFGLQNYTLDIISVYKRYLTDTAMITKLSVYYNDTIIPVKNLIDYSKLYNNSEEELDILNIKNDNSEIVITPNNTYEAISFANGIFTPLGGTHVDSWCEALFRPIVQKLNKPKKPQINLSDVKQFFRIFVVATVNQPTFESQSKLKLEGPVLEVEVKKSQLTKLMNWPVMNRMEDIIRTKELSVLKKVERKKRGYESVVGLEPANYEGKSKNGKICTLFMVEGKSAATYAVTGIEKGVFGNTGRDYNGILQLRGKILNTRNAKPVTVAKNTVVSNIIKALGLQFGLDYTEDDNYKKLRYGRVVILTDADCDGLHISGLIQNLFHSLFPTLLNRKEPFLVSMQTPIVRVFLKNNDILFYDEREYRDYVQKLGNTNINKKYYKGLGSSKAEDVLETFGEKMVLFKNDVKSHDTMNKAFNSKFSDMRKKWLEEYDPEKRILKWTGDKTEIQTISLTDFIDTELIKFSIEDCKRSIPNVMDGLKEGHRKVLYVTLLRNLRYNGKEIKVAQLAGSVAEKASYHHGEENLHKTIIGMAQCFVGSNNIPYFYRDGAFGSRLEGGDDSADGRYICTKLDMLTRDIFLKEDDMLLEHLEDDGEIVEPKYYVPIIPMILVNGCIAGIGTGWSCSVPAYNPKDIINVIKCWLENGNKAFEENKEENKEESKEENKEENNNIKISLLPEISPWYNGYTGKIEKTEDGKYISFGNIDIESQNKVRVTELPVGMWTNDFREFLEKLKEEKKIKSYENHCTPKVVDFTVTESDDFECTLETLKLSKTIRTSNMVLFNENGKLHKYSSIDEIIDNFCKIRYDFYVKRKKKQLSDLDNEISMLGNKKRFLEEIRDGILKLFKTKNGKKESRKICELVSELEEKKYDKIIKGKNEKDEKDEKEILLEEEKEEEKENKSGYEYLLNMQISNITSEKIDKLKNDIANRQKERETLFNTSEKEIWLKELDILLEKYEKWNLDLGKEKIAIRKKRNKK